MSVADGSGVVDEPTSIDNWKTILNAVIDDVQDCVLEGNGAGGMHYANSVLIQHCLGSHLVHLVSRADQNIVDDVQAKVVYIYAAGSMFENILNRYMSGYHRGIDPDNPAAFLQIAGLGPLTNSSLFSSHSEVASSR